MNLSYNLVKQFTKVTNNNQTQKKESTTYGVIVLENDKTYVKLDGTDVLTPVEKSMDAIDGDRVLISIKDHSAVVVGNVTSPASARTADSFMNLTEEGLVIGELDSDKNPIGTSALIAPGVYYIVDANGIKVASFTADSISLQNGAAYFSSDQVKLGKNGSSEIDFCNNAGKLKLLDNAFKLQSSNPVGIRHDTPTEKTANVVCYHDTNGEPIIQIQALSYHSTIVEVRIDGIDISTIIPEDGSLPVNVNGSGVVTEDAIIQVGTVTTSGSIAANTVKTITATVPVDMYYRLSGITKIATSKNNLCYITGYWANPSNNQVIVSVLNSSTSAQTVSFVIDWMAIRANSYRNAGTLPITW